MANSPMVIMWSNSNGNITLSQRQSPSEIMPTVVASPPRVATVDTSGSDMGHDEHAGASDPQDVKLVREDEEVGWRARI